MYTRCPNCSKVYQLTEKQSKKSVFFCGDCAKVFTVTDTFREKPVTLIAEAQTEFISKSKPKQKTKAKKKSKKTMSEALSTKVEAHTIAQIQPVESVNQTEAMPSTLPWESVAENISGSTLWLKGLTIGLLVLAAQSMIVGKSVFSQNAHYRRYVENICGMLSCELQPYHNLAELEVLQGALIDNTDKTVTFKAVITNQASYRQVLPKVKLTLMDFNEKKIAQRIFVSKEYRMITPKEEMIGPDETVGIHLTFIPPTAPIGGYFFDLVD
jgi:hypothetical protein